MRCADVEKQISRLVDGELPESLAAQVEAHLDLCEACLAFQEQVVSLNARLMAFPVSPVPVGLAASVRERITHPHGNERMAFVLPAWCRVPLMAALVFVALGIGGMSGRSIGELVMQPRSEISMEDVIPGQTGSFAQVAFDLFGQDSDK